MSAAWRAASVIDDAIFWRGTTDGSGELEALARRQSKLRSTEDGSEILHCVYEARRIYLAYVFGLFSMPEDVRSRRNRAFSLGQEDRPSTPRHERRMVGRSHTRIKPNKRVVTRTAGAQDFSRILN